MSELHWYEGPTKEERRRGLYLVERLEEEGHPDAPMARAAMEGRIVNIEEHWRLQAHLKRLGLE